MLSPPRCRRQTPWLLVYLGIGLPSVAIALLSQFTYLGILTNCFSLSGSYCLPVTGCFDRREWTHVLGFITAPTVLLCTMLRRY